MQLTAPVKRKIVINLLFAPKRIPPPHPRAASLPSGGAHSCFISMAYKNSAGEIFIEGKKVNLEGAGFAVVFFFFSPSLSSPTFLKKIHTRDKNNPDSAIVGK